MKKVFFACMTVGLLATSCDWFSSKPKDDTTVVTPDDQGEDSAVVTTDDSTVQKKDSAMAVAERTATKKEVK
ncbi:MAG: hypothetical protein U0X41_12685 [Chitinophagales bacterium]